MTAGFAQNVDAWPGGSHAPVDNSAVVRLSPADLVLLMDSLARSPSSPVSFLAEFDGSGVSATLSASRAQTVAIESVEYVALTCHLTEIVTAPGISTGFVLSERCSLLVRQGDGVGYLLAGEYPN